MPTIQLGDMGIAIQEWGSGEPLMLVHGLGMDSALWVNQMSAFSPHYRIIAVDLRGFGRSDRPTEPGLYAVEVLARDLYAEQLAAFNAVVLRFLDSVD